MTAEELAQINEKMELVATNVATFQKTLDDNDGTVTEKLKGLSDEIAGTITTVNEFKGAIEEQENKITQALTKIHRVPAGEETTEDIETRKSFVGYIRNGMDLTEQAKDEIVNYLAQATYKDSEQGWVDSKALEFKSLMVGNDPNGGVFVRPQFSNKVVGRTFETSPVRPIVTVENIGSESLELIIDDEEFSSGGWVDEVQARPDTDNGQVGKLVIHTHEQYAQPKATQKMLDDVSFNIEDWIIRKVSKKFGRIENSAYMVGDGAGKPKGMLAYAAWSVAGTYERNKVEQVNSGILGSFNADSFIDIQNAVKEDYQSNAKWLMKRVTFSSVLKLKNGLGAYLINPLLIATGGDKVLLGQPVIFADDVPAIANNSLSVVYGDFREGYTIVDRLGMRILRDPYTNKPYIRFYVTKRTGGAVTNYESFKIMKLAV